MRARPLSERFWEKVAVGDESDCWLWTAFRNRKGYGMIGSGAGHILAHRASWEIHHGPVPPGGVVCHRCDTPPCVNPSHLFVGTQRDNIADMVAKGRQRGDHRPGSACPTATLTESQAAEVKRRALAGEKQRALAAEFSIKQATVSNIKTGRTWGHLR